MKRDELVHDYCRLIRNPLVVRPNWDQTMESFVYPTKVSAWSGSSRAALIKWPAHPTATGSAALPASRTGPVESARTIILLPRHHSES